MRISNNTVLYAAVAMAIFVPAILCAQDVSGICPGSRVFTGFDSPDAIADTFSRVQVQNGGSIELVTDPLNKENIVAMLSAGPKEGKKVGKSDLILDVDPFQKGSIITMQGRFLFPADSALNSLIIMDLECASCGLDTNPGVRLYLRDARLRVDRSKIGVKQPLMPTESTQVSGALWETITWQVVLGDFDIGRSRVYLNEVLVMDAPGTTQLLQGVVSRLAPGLKIREHVDRFQIGLTANSNDTMQTVYLDDVTFCAVQGEDIK